MPDPAAIPITGCRHDVFGHALKAFGVLRTLNHCADEEHLDREAEAWWDTESGVFYLRSPKYPSETALARFFEQHYRPTPIFSPWNTGGGLEEKKEITFRLSRRPVAQFLRSSRRLLKGAGFRPERHRWKNGQLQFDLNSELDISGLRVPSELRVEISGPTGKRARRRLVLGWDPEHSRKFTDFVQANLDKLGAAGLGRTFRDAVGRGKQLGEKVSFTIKDTAALKSVLQPNLPPGIVWRVSVKTTGEKAVLANVGSELASDTLIKETLQQGREFFPRFQGADSARVRRELSASYRDLVNSGAVLALDAVFTTRASGMADNPVFLNRGKAGNTEIFRSFWSYFLEFRSNPGPQVRAALNGVTSAGAASVNAPGAPFFPDHIKTYNYGLGWVLQAYPFCALDYLLAVEGALALRGSATRLLGVRTGNFAAFPFVFETSDDMTNDKGEVVGMSQAVWLPVWSRPTAYAELESFVLDSQSRLPSGEVRFTAEFARAIRCHGVDTGFMGYQEFRFKLSGARVPWICTGRYMSTGAKRHMTDTAELLRPLDEAGFLDQLKFREQSGRSSPHRWRRAVLDAIENAVSEGSPREYLAILERLFEVNRLLAISTRFRESVGHSVFVPPLPQEPWLEALAGPETEPEFEIARALASIVGHAKQVGGGFSAEPFLGSLLPLTLSNSNQRWYLPSTPSAQAVWTGTDLPVDLGRVLSRRYLDSRSDERPALASPFPARLRTILRFLHGELDDQRIARYAEGLSLIGWHFTSRTEPEASQPAREQKDAEPRHPIPLCYAAVRSLLEIELERRAGQDTEKRRCWATRTVALLRERSVRGVAAATAEALRRLAMLGVTNPYGEKSRTEKPRLAGRDIVRVDGEELVMPDSPARRLAAAVVIPLHWRDHFALFRAITLPQTTTAKEES